MRVLVTAVGVLLLTAATAPAKVDQAAIDASIDKGVAALKKMQGQDGTWPQHAQAPETRIGATALAGLTLLECGCKDDDDAVKKAAAACRKVALTTLDTYSLSLLIVFLDRLDKPEDTPLIEAMIINLLASQNDQGGWGYKCVQAFSEREMKTLTAEAGDSEHKLKTTRDWKKLSSKGQRGAKELSAAAQAKLEVIAKGGIDKSGGNPMVLMGMGDNSNTQFATLALWAGRRYGVPTQAALVKIDKRHRLSQNGDGSWSYSPIIMAQKTPQMGIGTASMTCAGLLGVICGQGAVGKVAKDGKVLIDVSKDRSVLGALQALCTAVGDPVGWDGKGDPPGAIPAASEKAYYYLWSLERVCVLLGLETLGKKDWYNWGAEILLKNQKLDGTWAGEYGGCGADTCFALLFLKKANLLHDLAGSKKMADVERTLKSGPIKKDKGKKEEKPLPPLDIGSKPTLKDKGKTEDKKEEKKPKVEKKEEKKPLSEAAKAATELVTAKGKEREALLEKLRETKGGEYTEALSEVIPKLEGESKKLAREALADRLTRMTEKSQKAFLKDDDAELRRAAAIAVGQKDRKTLIPDVIDLLDDKDENVRAGARASLKAMAGKDLGDKPGPWRLWWEKQKK
jgi:hypothetical protein